MSRPTVLLLAMDDSQQADVRLALKDVANIVRSKTPAELIADEYRNLNPGAAIVAVRPDAPNRFGLIHNVAAAGGRHVVDQTEPVWRVGSDRDDRRARIQVSVLVGDQL